MLINPRIPVHLVLHDVLVDLYICFGPCGLEMKIDLVIYQSCCVSEILSRNLHV